MLFLNHIKRMDMRAFALFMSLLMCSCDAKDDARRALDDAKHLATSGDYEGALAKHVWFHDHALTVDPAYYGVRLSFALGDWVELGSKYPKALEKLTGIRDAKSAKLLAGDANKELFHDIASINRALGESGATVEVFKRIEAVNPAFAGTIYDFADESLLQSHEYALAKKYLGDPTKRLEAARKRYEEGMQFAKNNEHADVTRRAIERIFARKVVQLITVLKETGDGAAAREIQTDALKTLDHDMIRNAFEP